MLWGRRRQMNANLAAIAGVPAIINFQLLTDMGRMNQ